MRALTAAEIEGYTLAGHGVIDDALARRVRVQRVWLLPPGASGMTIGRYVLLLRDHDRSGSRALIAHELVHVDQFARTGVVRFFATYLRDYLRELRRLKRHRAAYLAIPAEVEAREVTRQWQKRRAWLRRGGAPPVRM